MATSVSISTTYAGQFSGKYIAAALLSAPTLDKELITIKPNIKYKEVVKTLSQANIIVDATCDFAATGSVSLAERILQPEEFQVNTQLCKEDFRSDWEAVEMGVSVYDNLPASFTDFLIANTAGQVAQQIELNIWSGSSAVNGQFTGLFDQLQSGSAGDKTALAANFVTASAQVTSSNVIAELTKVVNAIPNTVYGKEDLYIYVPTNIVKAYQVALGTANYQFNSFTGFAPLNFQGINLAWCPGMPSNRMIAAQKSNLFFGTALLSDKNEVKVLDMADLDGSQNVRVIMRYTAGVQYGIASDIVVYAQAGFLA
jgi:hypothetical protein